jgi:hypothetical protein
MKESDYNNPVFNYCEINGIWEPSEQATPEFTMGFWIKEWIARYLAGASVKYPEEFLAEPR